MDKNKQDVYDRPAKQFVIGDIHGAYKALLQCIAASGIDKEKDTLIILGDVADGWLFVKECVSELLTFKNLVIIRGNHDQWFMDYIKMGYKPELWVTQGGEATLESYHNEDDELVAHMKDYFMNSKLYYVDNKNRLYVHGGFNWHKDIEDNTADEFMWDRHAYQTAAGWESYNITHPSEKPFVFKDFNKVFVGHTSTQYPIGWKHKPGVEPVFVSNLINLDTGAGWTGKLTIMDADSLEYWQSDLVPDLYPAEFNKRG